MLNEFRQSLSDHGTQHAVWLGLDMPIGFVDTWYGGTKHEGANVKDFKALLTLLETDEWREFFDVCQSPDEIRHRRPFYPQSSGTKGSVKRDHLIKALGLADFDALHRACEFPTKTRNAACPSFWTLGANQVGKAMLHGLKHLILPGYGDGFHIWPFMGDLASLCKSPGVTLIETYPGEIYGWLGDTSELTKSNQNSRKNYLHKLRDDARAKGNEINDTVWDDIKDGFSPDHGKDDAFDALVGVMGLIEIAEGRRPEHLPRTPSILEREGWIVGLDPADVKSRKP